MSVKEVVRVKAGSVRRPDEPGPANFLSVVMTAATDPRCDVGKMQALLDMQREIEDRESKKAFNRAFIALQEELPTIRRDGKIEIREKVGTERTGRVQQSTPYATFNNIMKTIKPLLTRHGFALSFSTEPAGERLLVKGLLEGHGHERTTSFPLPAETSGSKNNVQGWGSSMSYGKRYCSIALLNIISDAAEDTDTDGNEGRFKQAKAKGGGEVLIEDKQVDVITEDQAIELRDLVEWCGVGMAKFLEHFGIRKLAELPANMFETAKKDCKDYHANQQQKAAARSGR